MLAKLIVKDGSDYTQMELAQTLYMSQSEISSSISRSVYAGLLFKKEKRLIANYFDFIKYGLAVVFPQHPGAIVRGTPTAHSAPLAAEIMSDEKFVWPYAKGRARGQSIIPLYPSVNQAIVLDSNLYEILALMDAVRAGRAREKI